MSENINIREVTTGNRIPFNFTYYGMKLLGRNLYSNPWTAISEIVANGIDAKAPDVYVLVDMRKKESASIEIFDNGYGMSYDDLCEKYTLIGRNKRESGENIDGKTLGRKGIGKLAALYLSSKYYLITKTKQEASGWIVDTSNISDSEIPTMNRIQNFESIILAQDIWEKCKTGTLIHLTDVNLSGIGIERLKGLKAILTDYYDPNYITSKISVCVLSAFNDIIKFEELKKDIDFGSMSAIFDNTDKEYYKKIPEYSYLLPIEGIEEIDSIKEKTEILNTVNYNTEGQINLEGLSGEKILADYKMVGWIGIHCSLNNDVLERNSKKKVQLHPNALRLYVRGKLAVNNLMTYLGFSQAFTNYVEGEISFDILDDDRFIDASTSNREGYSLSDPRVIKLMEITKKIITSLFRIRAAMGLNSNKARDAYYEKLRLQEEQQKKQAILDKLRVESELKRTENDLKSELNRNIFLMDSLSEDQVSFSEKLHMVRINCSTIKTTIDYIVRQKERGKLTQEDIWEGITKISYCNERIKAVLDYYEKAKFNPKDEMVEGDLFDFIYEYSKKIVPQISKENGYDTYIEVNISEEYNCKFVPQDIGVLLDNIISNSNKNAAQKLSITMYKKEDNFYVDICDDGDGLSPDADPNKIFEFGKSYKRGTGVGLFHVKEIIKKMGGTISLLPLSKGFGLRIKLK